MEVEMRAGKRLDCFKYSYTGDPLAAYRLTIAKAGFPNWMMFLDSGPTMAQYEAPVDEHAKITSAVPEPHVIADKKPGYTDAVQHGKEPVHKK
jgi:hypothetical protein